MKANNLIPLIFLLVLSGCTSVSRIGDYSKSALTTLKKYEELDYTFGKACADRCYMEQVRMSSLTTGGCQCELNETADSVTSVLYKGILGYYNGLSKLSDNELTNYKTKALATGLKSGNFADVKIDKATVDAYAKLSTVLLKAITDGYRQRKLKQYVEEANEPVQILIKALDINIASNLAGKLNVHKERLANIYMNFLQDSLLSDFQKKQVIDDYIVHVDHASATHKLIITFSKGLKSIRSGHQKLYDSRTKMKTSEMRAILAEYASDLEDIISDFNKLKSK